MSSSKALVSRSHISSGVLVITINRAQVVNCVDGETAFALEKAFVEFEEDPEARVAILRGEGGNFCSGADLQAVLNSSKPPTSGGSTPNPMNPDMSTTGPMGASRLALSKPVIAAISGFCLAGGLELASWCDLRVVGAGAQIGVKCRYRGVPLIDGGTLRLPRLIGHSRAAELILTGRTISAEEAFSIGFANRLVPAEDGATKAEDSAVLREALELATLIAGHPQTCMRNDRTSIQEGAYLLAREEEAVEPRTGQGRYNVRGGERAAMAREFELGQQSLASGEFVKQLKGFLAKSKL